MSEKINRNEAIVILTKFIKTDLNYLDWFKKIKSHVKAIVFYGSTAKGTNRPNSDLDILIFVPLKVEMEHTSGEYSYKFGDYEVNIVLRSVERLQTLGDDRTKDLFEIEVFRDCEILYESDSLVRNLIKELCEVAR